MAMIVMMVCDILKKLQLKDFLPLWTLQAHTLPSHSFWVFAMMMIGRPNSQNQLSLRIFHQSMEQKPYSRISL